MACQLHGFRKIRGISQERLARAASVSLNTIRSIEQDKTKPNVYLAKRLAQLLNTTVEILWPD